MIVGISVESVKWYINLDFISTMDEEFNSIIMSNGRQYRFPFKIFDVLRDKWLSQNKVEVVEIIECTEGEETP